MIIKIDKNDCSDTEEEDFGLVADEEIPRIPTSDS